MERLEEAVEGFFVRGDDFLEAFKKNPLEAILALRDDRNSFGPVRTYLGAMWMDTAHSKVMTAARAHYRLTHGYAAWVATRRDSRAEKLRLSQRKDTKQ